MSNNQNKCWVLTREHNDYDQHGSYFVAVFAGKPSHTALASALSKEGYGGEGQDVMAAVAFLEHMLAGGGRQEWEHVWFNLEAVQFNAHK